MRIITCTVVTNARAVVRSGFVSLQYPCTAVVVKLENDGVEIEYVTFNGVHCHLSNLAKLKTKLMDKRTVAEALVNMSAPPSKILGDSTSMFKDESTTYSV